MEQYKYTVCVRCITYNHSQYITDALNGFVSQQTAFPFVVVVIDDASTDGEQDVIRSFVNDQFDVDGINAENRETEYAHITCAPHKSNKNCNIVVLYLKYNHNQIRKNKLPYQSEWLDNSKYHALCEGDDYWIDPLKLQKQVDFLEANPGYGLVHTNYNIVGPNSMLLDDDNIPDFYKSLSPNKSTGYIYGELFNNKSSILTCTVMYRGDEQGYSLDHDLFMLIAQKYKIWYIEDVTSCYRISPNSMMRSQYDIVQSLLFKVISAHMLKYYQGNIDIHEYYKTSDLRRNVDLFFSKYVTHYMRKKCMLRIPILTIFRILIKNPRLLVVTPYNIIKRLCSSI